MTKDDLLFSIGLLAFCAGVLAVHFTVILPLNDRGAGYDPKWEQDWDNEETNAWQEK